MMSDPVLGVFGRQGPRENIALTDVAASALHPRKGLQIVDAFDDDFHAEGPGERDGGVNDLHHIIVGLAAFHSSAGVIGALVVGVLAGGVTLAIGQIAFATTRAPLVRVLIGLIYAVPAGLAGYQASLGLAEIGVPSESWRQAFAIAGAVLVSATAFTRMTLFVPPPEGPPIAEGPASPSR